jgi:hypothetical protein
MSLLRFGRSKAKSHGFGQTLRDDPPNDFFRVFPRERDRRRYAASRKHGG